jgi:putative Holliday junction resolvase
MDKANPSPLAGLSVEALAPLLPPAGRLMGLDLGTHTIGLALSDVFRSIATPARTIRRSKFRQDAAEIQALAQKEGVVAYVIGLPLNMDGSAGARVQATRAFVRNFAGLDPRPIAFWDERLSTAAAERYLIAADVSRAKRAAVIDATAAQFILQGALDRLAHLDQAVEPRD